MLVNWPTGLLTIVFGVAQGVVLWATWLVTSTADAPWAQYGVLGTVAAAELSALVWVTRRFLGHLEGAARAAVTSNERMTASLDKLEHSIENLLSQNTAATQANALAIQRISDRLRILEQ